MMMQATVYGPPQTMGSKRGFIVGKRVVITDTKGKTLKTFQESMREAMRECKPDVPHTGPMAYDLEIVLRRPKSHYRTGKNSGELRADAPYYCTTKPDKDKVERAVFDCGTGIWYRDDSQICFCDGSVKRYAHHGEEEHTTIKVRLLEVE